MDLLIPILILLGLGAGCQDEPELPPEMNNAPSNVAVEATAVVTAEPTHGGTIVAAGPHPLELVVDDGGEIEAYVVGEAPVPTADVHLTVHVPTESGPRPVVLVYDPTAARFHGRLRGPRIVAGPTEVVYVVEDRAYRGSVPAVLIVTSRPARATVEVRHERPAAAIYVEHRAPRAHIVVEDPFPSAHVDVRVHGPRHRGVVVRHHGPRFRGEGRHHRRHGGRHMHRRGRR